MRRKEKLLMALVNLDKDIASYQELIANAQKSLTRAQKQAEEIRSELNDTFKPERARYTNAEVVAARRAIVGLLAGESMHPRQICDTLAHMPTELLMRELHSLSRNKHSDVTWNGRKGQASKYGRI